MPSGASFAENFYDLKRVPSGKSASESLSRKAKWRSLLFLVSGLSGAVHFVMMMMMIISKEYISVTTTEKQSGGQ